MSALLLVAAGLAVSPEPLALDTRVDVTADATAPTDQDAPTFVPTFAMEMGYFEDEVRLTRDGAELSELSTRWNNRVSLGLGYDMVDLGGDFALSGHSALGFGLAYAPGDWLVHVRQEVAPAWDATSWLRFSVGLGLGLTLNTGRTDHSFGELGLPVTVRLAFVELGYSPRLTFALVQDTTDVLGGERVDTVKTGITPAFFHLRFRFEPLGF